GYLVFVSSSTITSKYLQRSPPSRRVSLNRVTRQSHEGWVAHRHKFGLARTAIQQQQMIFSTHHQQHDQATVGIQWHQSLRSQGIFHIFAHSLQACFPTIKSMVACRPPLKSPSGANPASRNFSIDAIECFTSPGRSAAYLISERDPVRRQIVFARSLMVICWP